MIIGNCEPVPVVAKLQKNAEALFCKIGEGTNLAASEFKKGLK